MSLYNYNVATPKNRAFLTDIIHFFATSFREFNSLFENKKNLKKLILWPKVTFSKICQKFLAKLNA